MKSLMIITAILLVVVLAQAKSQINMPDEGNFKPVYRCEVDQEPVKWATILSDGDDLSGKTYADLEFMDGTSENKIEINSDKNSINSSRGPFSLSHLRGVKWEWTSASSDDSAYVNCIDVKL